MNSRQMLSPAPIAIPAFVSSTLSFAFSTLFFLFPTLFCTGGSAFARDLAVKPYRIGVIMPFSGPVASLGNYLRNGIELSLAGLPAEKRKLIEVVFEDDQFEVPKTISAYQKLSAVGDLDAVFVLASPPANALAPILERKKQVLLAIGASDPTIVQGREFSFVHWVIPAKLGALLAKELQRREFKRIAFVTSEVSGALADTAATVAALEELELEQRIAANLTFPREQTDFKTDIAKLKRVKPDAVIVVMFPGSLSAFVRQARDANLGAEIVGMETFEDESEVKAAQGALLGTWYVNASDPTPEFVAQYKRRYGEHPGWAAANAFDSLNLITDAAAASGGTAEGVRDYLRAVNEYSGGAGSYSASGDNRFTLPAALKQITEQGFVPLPIR